MYLRKSCHLNGLLKIQECDGIRCDGIVEFSHRQVIDFACRLSGYQRGGAISFLEDENCDGMLSDHSNPRPPAKAVSSAHSKSS